MSENKLSDRALLFAERVVNIAFFEWKGNEHTASCLVMGQNEEADSLAKLLEFRCREADRIPVSEKIKTNKFLRGKNKLNYFVEQIFLLEFSDNVISQTLIALTHITAISCLVML